MNAAEQLELFPDYIRLQHSEPFRSIICVRCGVRWLTPDMDAGETYAVCPKCQAVVLR